MKHKQWKEMNRTVQDVKLEIESIKKTETVGNLKIKKLGTQAGSSEASLTSQYKRWKREAQALKTR